MSTIVLPVPKVRAQLVITPQSYESLGAEFANRGGNPSSGAWPSSNRALYIPFTLGGTAVAQKLFWANGTTANLNVDMGIYLGVAGKPTTLLVSTGSTAQSAAGTSVDQVTDITDIMLLAGVQYFMALVLSGTTGHIFRYTVPNQNQLTMCGMCESATSLPLVSNPTVAAVSSAYTPNCGITFGTAQV